jgi:hypothetical protein
MQFYLFRLDGSTEIKSGLKVSVKTGFDFRFFYDF